jgi:thiol-disulfide isomerase/thioredoxin
MAGSMLRALLALGLILGTHSSLASSSDLTATPILNEHVSIQLVKKDKPLLLQFWASWCHSCGTIMWDMDKLVSQHSHVAYAAVSIDKDFADASTYLKKHALAKKYADNYFFDTGGKLTNFYQVKSVPTIILLDQNDNICFRTTGHLNSDDLFELSNTMKKIASTPCNKGTIE